MSASPKAVLAPWSWLSPEDAVRIALASFYGACRDLEPETEPGPIGASWFLLTYTRRLVAGINAQALLRGVNKPECADAYFATLPEGLAWPPRRRNWPGAGQSPAVEGHGCPALSAVGPAQQKQNGDGVTSTVSACDITSPADPLFFASGVQELPSAITVRERDSQ